MAAGAVTEIEVNSASLTTASTAYTSGDVLGSEFTFTSAISANGGTGVLEKVVLHDDSDVIGAVDLFIAESTASPASDNAAFAPSDSNARLYHAIIPLPAPYDVGGARMSVWEGAASVKAASGATSLFGTLVTRSGHTFFGATTALRLKLYIRQDQ